MSPAREIWHSTEEGRSAGRRTRHGQDNRLPSADVTGGKYILHNRQRLSLTEPFYISHSMNWQPISAHASSLLKTWTLLGRIVSCMAITSVRRLLALLNEMDGIEKQKQI